MDIFSRFTEHLNELVPGLRKGRILVAVSGGADSMVLLRLCRDASLQVGVAHCNYGLRGMDSVKDEELVRDTAAAYSLPFYSRKFETEEYASLNKISIQLAARKLRYAFFSEIMSKEGYDYLFTAHHSDDNAETVLHNFLKGTGLAGLHGILHVTGTIVRPLLMLSKKELLSFAENNNVAFREDASNTSVKYTRNFLRNEIIPKLEEHYPAVKANLLENIRRFGQVEKFYRHSVKKELDKLIVKNRNEVHIPVKKLLNIPGHEALLFELLKEFGFSDALVQNVLKLAGSQSGKYVSSETHRVFRNRAWFIVSPVHAPDSGYVHISEKNETVQFPGGTLKFSTHEGSLFRDEGATVAWIDADKISFPLLLRRVKAGDYFYPLGLLKTSGKPAQKKVSRFMNDRKMSVPEKEQQWVVESSQRIIWLPGLRADHRFSVTPATKNTLRIELVSQ